MQARRGDDGFTLVELLVVMVVMGVIGGMVTTSVVSGFAATRRADVRITAITDLQRGVERVGRELRAADPMLLDAAGDFSGSVSAVVYRDGEKITYSYYIVPPEEGETGNPELREDVVRSDLDGNVIQSQSGLFISDIANLQTGVPVFTYFAVDPSTSELVELTCDGLTDTACRDRHLTASQVRLSLQKLLPEQDPIEVETVVNIRNTRYEPTGG